MAAKLKNIIKSIVPVSIRPLIRKLYWMLFKYEAAMTQEEYQRLAALKCIISYNKYGGYCIPESSRHRPAAQKILMKRVHEPETIEFIRSHCGNGDVVHAGTYFGDFLPAISHGLAQGAMLWAFEPNSENYRCAKITLEINGLENVELVHAGLGAKSDSLFMQTADARGSALGGSSRIVSSTQNIHGEKVSVVAIDNVIDTNRKISIIQLDVEGYEKEVLHGAMETIKRLLPILVLEVNPDSTLLDSEWFSENILSLGYSKTDTIHANVVYRCNRSM